jgi:hypothetical protein
MTPTAEPKSRTQRVDELIHETGNTMKKPATGWHKEIQRRLLAEGITVNDSLIYKRQKLLSGAAKKVRPGKKRFANYHVNANGRPDPEKKPAAEAKPIETGRHEMTLNELSKVRELAKELGGWDVLVEAVEYLKAIRSEP